MTDYERYVNELAAKYGVTQTDRHYDGDCVVSMAAIADEQEKMAALWRRCHTDGEREW